MTELREEKIWYFHMRKYLCHMMVLNHQRMLCNKIHIVNDSLACKREANTNSTQGKRDIQIILLHVVEEIHLIILPIAIIATTSKLSGISKSALARS
jgi:hypothetical protein